MSFEDFVSKLNQKQGLETVYLEGYYQQTFENLVLPLLKSCLKCQSGKPYKSCN